MNQSQTIAFALLSEFDGQIVEILSNQENFLTWKGGDLLYRYLPNDEIRTMLDFIIGIKSSSHTAQQIFHFEINGKHRKFYVAGSQVHNKILLLASSDLADGSTNLDEIMRINNEQINLLRESVKMTAYAREKIDVKNNSITLDEFTRINNELITIQRELTKKNKELDELNKLKNAFLGIAAHDIRSPISTIIGFSSLLLEERDKIEPSHQIYLEHIEKAATFMLQLAEDLLDITNIESGKLSLNREIREIRSLITENISINQFFADRKNINIRFEKPYYEVHAFIDKPKIEQVLNNLLSNAIKYSFPDKNIYVKLYIENEDCMITIKDEGQGIPENELSNLFKTFQTTSVQATAGEKSTGLGLWIVKNIVNAHGGEIHVHSKTGLGTTFTIKMPLHKRIIGDS